MKTAVIMGTRPEIIKLEPIISKLSKRNCSIIFSGQHHDYQMGLSFLKQLNIRRPDFSLRISKSNPNSQISQMIGRLSKILQDIKPDTVIVQGDTNTVLASSLCSLKLGIPISHVEAGLRSFDWRMPEEHNRIVTDHISDLLFAPTRNAKNNLTSENIHGKIHVTGNTVIDAINKFSKVSSSKSRIMPKFENFVLFTLHRAENVDAKPSLVSIIKSIISSKENFVFPIHPRTMKRLHEFGLYEKLEDAKNIQTFDSLGYFDMLELMKKCSFIVTDSGGLQEEATSPTIRKKVLVIRKSTDRPESVESGLSELVGTDTKKILSAIRRTSKDSRLPSTKTPYGNGQTAAKILKIISDTY